MARVKVTQYECEHDLLPAVCVKCGGPADECVVRTFRIIDTNDRWGFWQTLATLYGLLVFPPLLLWALRRARRVQVKVPVCNADLERVSRQEKLAWWVIPFWLVWVLLIDVSIVMEFSTGRPGLLGVGVVIIPLFLASLEAITRLPKGHPRRSEVKTLSLTGVHPAFVAALIEDRARDRVANPDRRALRGDARDDFDEEPI